MPYPSSARCGARRPGSGATPRFVVGAPNRRNDLSQRRVTLAVVAVLRPALWLTSGWPGGRRAAPLRSPCTRVRVPPLARGSGSRRWHPVRSGWRAPVRCGGVDPRRVVCLRDRPFRSDRRRSLAVPPPTESVGHARAPPPTCLSPRSRATSRPPWLRTVVAQIAEIAVTSTFAHTPAGEISRRSN